MSSIAVRTVIRAAIVAAIASVMVAVFGSPAMANHESADVTAVFEEVTDPVIPGGVLSQVILIYNNTTSTQTVTVTDLVPAGTTFLDVSTGFLPVPGGPPGGPACTAPPVGGTGSVVCTVTLGPGGSPTAVAQVVVRLRVDAGLVPGDDTVLSQVTVAPIPGFTTNGEEYESGVEAAAAIYSAGPVEEIITSPGLHCQAPPQRRPRLLLL